MTAGGLDGIASIGVGVGNTLEAVVGTLLLTRVAHFRPSFERVRDVIAFLGIGALGSTLLSATVGVTALSLTGQIGAEDPWIVWLTWRLGDVGGAIILTPVILIAIKGTPSWNEVIHNTEFWVVSILTVALSLWSVSSAVTGPLGFVAVFTPFPVVAWAGSRLGSRGAVLATFAIMSIALWRPHWEPPRS